MKKLLAKFKISSALNSGIPLRGFWRKQVSATPELEQFEQSARELERLLKQPAGQGGSVPSPSLHASIMRAVRQSGVTERQDKSVSLAPGLPGCFRWGLAAALVVGLGIGGWLVLGPLADGGGQPVAKMETGPALPAVGPVMEQLATNGVAILTLPMTRQIEGLRRDVHETTQFLLASLP